MHQFERKMVNEVQSHAVRSRMAITAVHRDRRKLTLTMTPTSRERSHFRRVINREASLSS
jgi:hypothetical protein